MRLKRKYNTAILKNQLLAVIDLLEQHKVPYHLEGGSLLGIVRDKGIIPWDHDTDISIMAADFEKFKQIIPKIKNKNYRVKVKGFERDGKFKVLNKERIVKIKDKIFFFFAGSNTLDVFIKYPVENKVYWEAKQNTMCVDEKFYLGYEEIEWEERKVKVPLNYKEYLSLKYGDWNIINKEWDCNMELTIVEKVVIT